MPVVAKEQFPYAQGSVSASADDCAPVTPSDTDDLPFICKALYVGTAGNLSIVTKAGNTVILTNVVGLLPIRVKRVTAANTTATNISALF